MKNTIKSFIILSVAVVLIFISVGDAFATDSSKEQDQVNQLFANCELFAHEDATISDLKVFHQLFPEFSVFFRHRTTFGFDDKVNSFFLTDFGYNLVDKIDAVLEIQAIPGSGIIPRLGAQYGNTFGSFYVYLLPSYNPKDYDLEFEHIFSYSFQLTRAIALKPQTEIIINVLDYEHNFSITRSRLGISTGKYYFGVGLDSYHDAVTDELNPGVFLHVTF